MKLTKSALLDKYGIYLPAGKYQINAKDNFYEIYTIRDDTEGCILVGNKHSTDYVGESRTALTYLMEKLREAKAVGEGVTIEIVAEAT